MWFRILALIVAVLLSLLFSTAVPAAIVTLSTSTPTGTASRNAANDFIGLLSSNSPNQVLGQNVGYSNIPAGAVFTVGDLTGRDIDASGGGRVWTYQLDLPADAFVGTGFEDIQFDATSFERDVNNLESPDELTWDLFLNGSTTAVDSASTGVGGEFSDLDISISR